MELKPSAKPVSIDFMGSVIGPEGEEHATFADTVKVNPSQMPRWVTIEEDALATKGRFSFRFAAREDQAGKMASARGSLFVP